MATGAPDRPSLSLIIPAFNEHQGIRAAAAATLEVLEASGAEFEVIIVDDGSTDGTKEIIEKEFSGRPRVKTFFKPANGGFGSALREGIKLAALDHVTFFPVDNPLTPPILASLLENLGRADVLVGYRPERIGYTPAMKLKSKFFELTISAVFGLGLRDYNWIHVYPRRVLAPAGPAALQSDGVFALAELLIKCKRLGLSFLELPVPMRGRDYGVKTAATTKAAVRTALEFFSFLRASAAGRP